MKTRLLFFTIILSCSLFTNYLKAQKNHLSLSFSNFSITGSDYTTASLLCNIQVDYDHKVQNSLSVGAYLGFGPYQEHMFVYDIKDNVPRYALSTVIPINYGIKSNFYLNPIVFKSNISRFELYLSGKCGITTLIADFNNKTTPKGGNYINASTGAGISFYLTKKLGLNTEMGYRYFKYKKGFTANYGLTFRF